MKLASRCTACGTLFSVVRDQLWVSDGRVRCGHCGVAFNAFDQLYDLQQGKPPMWRPDQNRSEATPTAAAPQAAAALPPEAALDGPAAAATEADAAAENMAPAPVDGTDGVTESAGAATPQETETFRFDAFAGAPWDAAAARERVAVAGTAEADEQAASAERPALEREAVVAADVDAATVADAGEAERSDAPFSVEAPAGPEGPSSTPSEPAPPAASASQRAPLEDAMHPVPGDPTRPGIASASMPSFLRHAERRERWSRPGVRIALGAAVVVLVATLLLQGALHFRDRLAAHSAPAARVLAWWCARSGCTIGPPRGIADLTVESSVLSRVPGDDGLVRLALTVRNRGSVAAALPALEMSLTDASGKVVVRRAVRLTEMAGAPAVLPPQVDVPLQLLFATGGQRIAGFTIELFYP